MQPVPSVMRPKVASRRPMTEQSLPGKMRKTPATEPLKPRPKLRKSGSLQSLRGAKPRIPNGRWNKPKAAWRWHNKLPRSPNKPPKPLKPWRRKPVPLLRRPKPMQTGHAKAGKKPPQRWPRCKALSTLPKKMPLRRETPPKNSPSNTTKLKPPWMRPKPNWVPCVSASKKAHAEQQQRKAKSPKLKKPPKPLNTKPNKRPIEQRWKPNKPSKRHECKRNKPSPPKKRRPLACARK